MNIQIKDLSKEELLSLIYNSLSNTRFGIHPCFCAACAKGYYKAKEIQDETGIVPLGYVCDHCNETEKHKKEEFEKWKEKEGLVK